jgi:hypothetical protein
LPSAANIADTGMAPTGILSARLDVHETQYNNRKQPAREFCHCPARRDRMMLAARPRSVRIDIPAMEASHTFLAVHAGLQKGKACCGNL